jgi:DNA-binding LacI/PurR family transcriptional regulator
MPVSIKDLARMAGVSHSTVSRALRGHPGIPEQTTERIRRIAAEAGYRASAVARSLVTRRTNTIGLVVTSIADPFHGEVVAGLEDAANKRGYSVILANSHANPEREMSVVRSFGEGRVDGIIVASSRVGALYDSLLIDLGIPIVLLNNQHPTQSLHSVSIDNCAGSRAATTHLIELGHRKIAYVGDESGLESDTERLKGYRTALKEAGLSSPDTFIAHGDGKPEGGYRAMMELLEREPAITATVAYNDMSAAGVCKATYERGLDIPGDISVTGFDDLFFAEMLDPPLTTVRQPKRLLGEKAMQLMLDTLAGHPKRKTLRIRGELIVRNSTGAAKRSHGSTSRSLPGRTQQRDLRSKA